MKNISDEYLESQLKYLKLLSKQYPSISSASAEIINLEAILSLPKGTEHFLSDLRREMLSAGLSRPQPLLRNRYAGGSGQV